MPSKLSRTIENNVYALNKNRETIHISEAVSGKRGYFCLGCGREMQAVKPVTNIISYFRHDPKAVEGKGSCTYSDETYRHKLAKEILQRIKLVKVPSLYKYPPKGFNGKANLIKKAEIVEAHSVGLERYFYEDDKGSICWVKQSEIGERHYLFKPDVTFFDNAGKPFLLIEIIATHGIKAEKLAKIKRIGIDTIQITIPKSSPEDIEKSFYSTEGTKWIYNYEQEHTKYIPVSDGDTAEVSDIDAIQRELFEETYLCRAAEINNLIRSIRKCLGGEPYRRFEQSIRAEIERVESNSERNRKRLDELQEGFRIELSERFRGEEEILNTGTEELRNRYTELERRYKTKRAIEEEEIRRIQFDTERVKSEIQNRYKSIATRRDELKLEENQVNDDLAREQFRKSEIGNQIERLGEEFRAKEIEISRSYKSLEERERGEIADILRRREQLPNRFENLFSAARDRFEKLEAEDRRAIQSIEDRRDELPREFEQRRSELKNGIEELRRETSRSIENRTIGGSTEFSRKIKELLNLKPILLHIPEIYFNATRIKTARECIASGSYKKWY